MCGAMSFLPGAGCRADSKPAVSMAFNGARGRHEESRRPLPRGAGFSSLIGLTAAAQAAMASTGSLVSSMVAAAVLEMGI